MSSAMASPPPQRRSGQAPREPNEAARKTATVEPICHIMASWKKVSLKRKRAQVLSTWHRACALRTLNENASRYPYLHLPQSANTRQRSNRESFWGENRFQTQAEEGPERRRQRRTEAFQTCAKDSAGLGGGRVQHEVQPFFFENRPKKR